MPQPGVAQFAGLAITDLGSYRVPGAEPFLLTMPPVPPLVLRMRPEPYIEEAETLADIGDILRSALSAGDWDRLIHRGRPQIFEKGEAIVTRGTPGDCIYLIQRGRVEVSLMLADGAKAVLDQMGPGEVLGELAVLDGGPRSADAVAASGPVQVVVISGSHVFEILDASSDVVSALIAELCRRVRNASKMFEVKSEKSARVRISRTLLHLASKWGERNSTGAVRIPGFSQSEFGDFAGITRESVNRQLKSLEEERLIRRDDTGVTLLDVDGIADMAQL